MSRNSQSKGYYAVLWVNRRDETRRGWLEGTFGHDEARSIARLRNEMFPEDFYWVIELPSYNRLYKRLRDRAKAL